MVEMYSDKADLSISVMTMYDVTIYCCVPLKKELPVE